MNIVAVYVFWDIGNAEVFAHSYRNNLAGVNHTLFVICNDGFVSPDKREIFKGIPSVFLEGDNIGHDIGAFQQVARLVTCDMLVCFGSTAYLRGPGWLSRMHSAFNRIGNHLYGSMANRGNGSSISPHIRTTGFWLSPHLFNAYPYEVTAPEHRYPFEHGPECLTSWVLSVGHKAVVVGWHHENAWPDWNIANGFHDGDQREVIVGDRLSRPPYFHCA